VKMSSNEFKRICGDLSSIGDTVTIAVTKDSVKFTTSGDIGEANITCRRTSDGDVKEEVKMEDGEGGAKAKGVKSSEGQQVDIDLQEPVTLTFALRYLNSFCKATTLCDSVRLQLSKELPVVVQYLIEDMGYVRFYLAPKIEEEDADES
jgi:proliferating cell nuclear antigen